MICPRCKTKMQLTAEGSKKGFIAERYDCVNCALYIVAPKVSPDNENNSLHSKDKVSK